MTKVAFDETELQYVRLGLQMLQQASAVVLEPHANIACHMLVDGLISKIDQEEQTQHPIIEHVC